MSNQEITPASRMAALLAAAWLCAGAAIAQDRVDMSPLAPASKAAIARFDHQKQLTKEQQAAEAAELMVLTAELAKRLGRHCQAGACVGIRPPRPHNEQLILIREGLKQMQQVY